jgi:quercetin dioxygenase-like cupin family protein/SAM-dependent methyltransferase|tara:strand:+ start:651 stop:2321 length:1671 start_codon:yes stop_codon:yes gene_type:complete
MENEKIKIAEYLGRKLESCRICKKSELYEFLDLGFHPPADAILNSEEIEHPEIHFPLKVCQCENCGLTQLSYAVNKELLYGEKYKYESSTTETGKNHFFKMANSICDKFGLNIDSLVIDLGSNVGVLLEGFKKRGMRILGIDPAPKIAKIANERGIETWQSFIEPNIASKVVAEKGKAKIIVATNVVAHIDDKEDLIQSVKMMLDEEGVFIIEAPYLVDLIDNLEYDTIYLDHLEYLSIKPLVRFFDRQGMDIFDVEKYDIHGKSIRVFVCKKGQRQISENVQNFLNLEQEKGIYEKETLDNFAKKVKQHKKDFVDLLRNLKKDGKKIIGISAPAKGNTLLNYCKVNTDLIDYAVEKATIKHGHYTPSMHIPILSEKKLLEDNPDYGVIFAWNFADEIIKNNSEFAKRGGKFIIPIPQPIIMENKENLFGVKVKKIEPVHMDERGRIIDLLNEKINHVGFITSKKDSIRGNHYHKLSIQYNYIVSGKIEISLAKAEDPSKVEKVVLGSGEFISIQPGIIHKFKAIEDSVFLDMISESREGTGFEDDVVRVKIGELE